VQLRRAIVSGTVGTIIEAYDFLLYVQVAPLVFAKLYFPSSDPLVGTLSGRVCLSPGRRRAVRPLWRSHRAQGDPDRNPGFTGPSAGLKAAHTGCLDLGGDIHRHPPIIGATTGAAAGVASRGVESARIARTITHGGEAPAAAVTAGIWQARGVFLNDVPGGFLDKTEVTCPIVNDIVNDAIPAGHGYCTLTDKDGDKAFLVWRGKGTSHGGVFQYEGTFEWTGGTGKFQGLQGNNNYHGNDIGKAGGFVAVYEGEWRLP
jgi:hypothetical protein